MSEAPGPLNFTMFLTLFGEKLTGELSAWLLPGFELAVSVATAWLWASCQCGYCLALS